MYVMNYKMTSSLKVWVLTDCLGKISNKCALRQKVNKCHLLSLRSLSAFNLLILVTKVCICYKVHTKKERNCYQIVYVCLKVDSRGIGVMQYCLVWHLNTDSVLYCFEMCPIRLKCFEIKLLNCPSCACLP